MPVNVLGVIYVKWGGKKTLEGNLPFSLTPPLPLWEQLGRSRTDKVFSGQGTKSYPTHWTVIKSYLMSTYCK